ncbi:hypothetical protein D3C85_1066020 [compost metagenome]
MTNKPPRLQVHPGGRGGQHGLHLASAERLGHVLGGDGGRHCADQLGHARAGRVVGTEFQALKIRHPGHRLVAVQTLRWPGHGIQQAHAVFQQTLFDGRPAGLPESFRLVVVGDQKRQAIERIQRVFIAQHRHEQIAELNVLARHCGLDLGALE